ncbi:hypothetical protein [Flavobacterium sp. 5]|uniref:hypothetical protein n=1 Tax=Flavobacterium sp. 5 TaxID=2035199 RepID=UPI000C2C6385|nr:hypothetical protein [Flavobacterium sp. 5]
MKTYKSKFLIVLAGLLSFSCMNIDCVKLSESYKVVECLIIVSDLPDNKSVYNFEINGRSLKTGKDTVYEEENRWFCKYYKEIEKGDTIIKKKGELIFNIHKKDTILKFNWECEGKIYN